VNPPVRTCASTGTGRRAIHGCPGRSPRGPRRRHCAWRRNSFGAAVVRRYYDPATEQFLSVDPLVDATGTPFAFTGGDPVNGVDPSGLFCWGLCSFTQGAHDIATEVTSHARGLAQIGIDAGAVVGTGFVCAGTLGVGCYAAAVGFGSAASWGDYAVSGSPITGSGSLHAIDEGAATGTVGYACIIGFCGGVAAVAGIETTLGAGIGVWDYATSCQPKSVNGYVKAAEGGALSNGPWPLDKWFKGGPSE